MSKQSKEAKTEEKAPRSGGPMLVVAIVVGLLVGAGGGAFIVAPLVGTKAVAVTSAHAQEPLAEGEEPEPVPCDPTLEGPGLPPKSLHTVENLVLNPARSGGTRFLMATVAIGVRDDATAAELKERDAEVRDVLLSVLGSKSVTELSEVSARDSLRAELRGSLGSIVRAQSIQQVYFPQFVIQ
jgi:flagellar protein FliL